MTSDEPPQATPEMDSGWRRIRDGMPAEIRERLFRGELTIRAEDPDTGETHKGRLRPPDWLEVEQRLDEMP